MADLGGIGILAGIAIFIGAVAFFILLGKYINMWFFGINELIAEIRANRTATNAITEELKSLRSAQLATAAELRALRADIAALNNQPPPS